MAEKLDPTGLVTVDQHEGGGSENSVISQSLNSSGPLFLV